MTSPLTPQTSSALLRLLDVPDAGRQRVNELDRLRKGLFRASSKGMVAALNRVADLVAVGAGSLDVSTVPPRRVARAGDARHCGQDDPAAANVA